MSLECNEAVVRKLLEERSIVTERLRLLETSGQGSDPDGVSDPDEDATRTASDLKGELEQIDRLIQEQKAQGTE